MIISVASGKGGTGKTTVSVNLALYLSENTDKQINMLDCDVEAPNSNIFIHSEPEKIIPVNQYFPEVTIDKCDFCAKCVDICSFNAIVSIPKTKKLLIFDDLCHSCNACVYICPHKALKNQPKQIGNIEISTKNKITLRTGVLDIGEMTTTYLIKQLRKYINPDTLNILDAPPGVACSTVETIVDSDFVIIVTEPTPFGLYDMKLIIGIIKELDLRFGVVINKAEDDNSIITDYCRTNKIDVIADIPYKESLAKLYSEGQPLITDKDIEDRFKNIYEYINNL